MYGTCTCTVYNCTMKMNLPDALSLDPELIDASASGLCASLNGLTGVGGVNDDSGFSIFIWNVIWMAFTVILKKKNEIHQWMNKINFEFVCRTMKVVEVTIKMCIFVVVSVHVMELLPSNRNAKSIFVIIIRYIHVW